MHIRSHFLQSEMIFWRFGSEVTDHGDHIVVKTPRNPSWRWGNLLLFAEAPSPKNVERWPMLNDHYFGAGAHQLFVWDTLTGEPGDAQLFVDLGYSFTRQPLLAARSLVLPEIRNKLIETRPIADSIDWKRVIDINNETFAKANLPYQDYITRKFGLYREMVGADQGFWMGAFEGERLLGSCGVFTNGEITRYQEVVTAEPERNKGVCTRLVHDAFQHARKLGYPELTLMSVDHESQAERIYRRLGFQDREMTCALRLEGTKANK